MRPRGEDSHLSAKRRDLLRNLHLDLEILASRTVREDVSLQCLLWPWEPYLIRDIRLLITIERGLLLSGLGSDKQIRGVREISHFMVAEKGLNLRKKDLFLGSLSHFLSLFTK